MSKNLCLFVLALLSLYFPAKAQYVNLSPSFGDRNGFTFSNLQAITGTTIIQRTKSVMVQPDGKIILACESTNDVSMLLRLNDDGTPDVSFGVAGKVVIYAGKITKALLQNDGKILMTLDGNGTFIFLRYNSNGTPDVSFGNQGLVLFQAGYANSICENMILQNDGKIVAVGTADYFVQGQGYNSGDGVVIRLNTNGSPDNSFNENGKLRIDALSGSDPTRGVAFDFSDAVYPTGKIVIGGDASPGSGRRFYTARILPNGSLDNTYGGSGYVVETYSNNAFLIDVKVFPNGKVLAGGGTYKSQTATFDLTLIKYNVDGSRDTNFSGDGITIRPSGTTATSAAVAEMQLLANDKFVVASSRPGGVFSVKGSLTAYNADGSLDTNFDGDGVVDIVYSNTTYDNIYSLTIDNNGRYLIGGDAQKNNNRFSFAVNRYNLTGSIDNSFSGDGMLAENYPASFDYGQHILRQPDGKLLVAGLTRRNDDGPAVQVIYDYVILRYKSNGTLDSSWGTNGIIYTGLAPNTDAPQILLQPDGKVVLVANLNNKVVVARYTSLGAVDVSFDGDGKNTFQLIAGYAYKEANSIGIRSDGKILIACVAVYNSIENIAILKLNPNGSLVNPNLIDQYGAGKPLKMLVLPNDTILLTVTNNAQGNLKRILPNGMKDATFGGISGTINILTPANSAPSLNALTRDASGNIFVAGNGIMGAAGGQGLLAKVKPEGVMDNTFGSNGVVMTDIPAAYSESYNYVDVLSNGTILTAGTLRRAATNSDLLVTKFSANGVLDLSLNNNTGYFSPDLLNFSYEDINSYVLGDGVLYGTGNIRTELGADLLMVAIDIDAAVLPVSFSNFSASRQNTKALLHWVTALEQNLQHYVVERSSNGINFSKLAAVAVKLSSPNGNSYYFTDQQPLPGTNYYRIKSVDLDGSTSATSIKMVNFAASKNLQIFPNPAVENIKLRLPASSKFPAEIKIYDNLGRLVHSLKTRQTENIIEVKNFTKGVYNILAGEALQGSFIKN